MVPLEELAPGLCVKVIDQWCRDCDQNTQGRMDQYLGWFVTVDKIYPDWASIKEDGGRWCWNANCFDYIVGAEEPEDIEIASDEDIYGLLFDTKHKEGGFHT